MTVMCVQPEYPQEKTVPQRKENAFDVMMCPGFLNEFYQLLSSYEETRYCVHCLLFQFSGFPLFALNRGFSAFHCCYLYTVPLNTNCGGVIQHRASDLCPEL